jgi:hypothetical protein
MTNIPDPFLPPSSQPWGRWVTTTLRNYLAKRQEYDLATYNAIKQLNLATSQPMRGVISKHTTSTVAIATAGVYVPINETPVLNSTVAFNMSLSGAPNVTGLKNTTSQARTVVFTATYDGTCGDDNAIGLKLALNGVVIDETECTSLGGAGGDSGNAMTHWIMRVEPDADVSMYCANLADTTDMTIARLKMTAHAIP